MYRRDDGTNRSLSSFLAPGTKSKDDKPAMAAAAAAESVSQEDGQCSVGLA